MNKLDVQQTGGFPFETDTLEFTQNAYAIFNALGELAGNLAIVSGCEAVGSTITKGTVYINGELLEFRGGTVGGNVIIRQENTQRTFEDGKQKDVYQTRYATFGTGTTMYPWADFKRIKNLQQLKQQADGLQTALSHLKPIIEDIKGRISPVKHHAEDLQTQADRLQTKADGLQTKADDLQTQTDNLKATLKELKNKIVPIGAIMMWSGTRYNIPNGWKLCDGRFGTPDLQDRFVVGAGYHYDISEKGGKNSVTLTADECATPEHYHHMFVDEEGGWAGYPAAYTYVRKHLRDGKNSQNYSMSKPDSGTPSVGKTSTAGGHKASPHENRPPYYALAFIQFKGN